VAKKAQAGEKLGESLNKNWRPFPNSFTPSGFRRTREMKGGWRQFFKTCLRRQVLYVFQGLH